MQNVYGEKYEDYLKSIDLLGFRSSIQRNLFLKSSSLEKKHLYVTQVFPKSIFQIEIEHSINLFENSFF